ncbi:hypothetical protein [Marivirga sp.]|uniref:hypothetical protein n=1 Tax=Marivirga sp. TaxID=2018662 RepID=UPI003DA72D55
MRAPNHRHEISTTENAQLKDLFLAIYFNDLEQVKAFHKKHPLLYKKKRGFYLYLDLPLDLVQLTLLNQKVWGKDDWRKEILPFVRRQRAKTEKMMAHWENEFKEEELVLDLQYNLYSDFFFCNEPEDYDEVVTDPMKYFLEKGFRKIDLQLYNRVDCLDFEAVKALLEKGAQTKIDFYGDGNSSAYRRALDEISYLATCEVFPEFQYFEKEGYNQDFHLAYLAGHLIGLVAHEEMYELIKPNLEEHEYKERD